MSKALKTKIIRYLITFVSGLSVSIAYAASRNFPEQTLTEQYRILCDGFFLPGVLMVLIGLMFVMNNLGALDTITYLVKYGVRSLVPGAFGEMEHLVDYVEARRENRPKGYAFLLVVGGVFLAVSVVFLILFYSVYQK